MKAQLKMHNGTPTVFLNDQPAFFGCHLVGYMDPNNLDENQHIARKYAEAGVHIYSIDTLNVEWCGPHAGDPSHYDFSIVVPRMQSYIDVDPHATFLLRMCFETRWTPGNWWNQTYPDEVEVLSDGVRYTQSFASEVWKAQVHDFLRAYIEYLKSVGMYDRVMGFQVDAGSSGEWIKDMSCMMQPTMDYSAPMQRHFQSWLRERYGDDAALQKAWVNPTITLDSGASRLAPGK